MHEIIVKTFELIDAIDKSDLIKNIELSKKEIDDNIDLKELIKKGNNTDDKYMLLDIKNQLYKYDEYKNYMKYYNELMFLVMDINSRYKKIIGKGSCFK